METYTSNFIVTVPYNSKYLTYKEWKPTSTFNLLLFIFTYVSTLPIRNGNIYTRKENCIFIYVNVCKYLTYKEWKQVISRAQTPMLLSIK